MNTTIHITAEYTDRLAMQYNAAVAECMPFSVCVRARECPYCFVQVKSV